MEIIKQLNSSEKWVTTMQIVAKNCPKCGYDRAILAHSDMASAGYIECNNPECKHTIEEI